MKPRSSTQHICLAACLPAFTGRSYLLLFLCSVATSGGGGGGACVLFRATALVRHLFICDPQMPLVVVLVVDGLLLLSAIHAIRSFVRFAGMYLCTYVGSVSIIPCWLYLYETKLNCLLHSGKAQAQLYVNFDLHGGIFDMGQ